MKYLEIFENFLDKKIGAGCLPYCKTTGRFLLGLRSVYVSDSFTWAIWGGAIDNEEDNEEAARRELFEETKYNGQIQMIELSIFEDEKIKYSNYLGIVTEEFKPIINWENREYKWVSLHKEGEKYLFKYEYRNRLVNLKEKIHFGLNAILENPTALKILEENCNIN